MKKRSYVIVGASVFVLALTITIYYLAFPSAPGLNNTESTEENETTHGDLALQWRQLAWKDENGEIPPNAIARAIQERDDFLANQSHPDGFSEGGMADINWVSRGPQNIGGRTRSIVIHPTDPDTIWAGSVSGGVWKSTDRGGSWLAQIDGLSNFAVSSLAIDPTNPDVLYAGTGEGLNLYGQGGFNMLSGAGIFKSVNGGVEWTRIPSTEPESLPTGKWSRVDKISIASDGVTILAAIRGGIVRSSNAGVSWTTPMNDVYKAHDVKFDPADDLKAVAHVTTNNGFFDQVRYSADGGVNWQLSNRRANASASPLPFFLPDVGSKIELAYASAPNSNIVYAMFPVSCSGGTKAGISRSEDVGITFTDMQASGTMCPFGPIWHHSSLWVSPDNPNFIVVGGYHLFKSTDGGNTLQQISDGYIQTAQPHPDQLCVVSDPSNSSRVYVCNDGGVFKTENIATASTTSGWESKNIGYQTTQFYGAAGHGPSDIINGGTQDNGEMRLLPTSPAGLLWIGGDGGFAAIDPNDPNYVYGEHQYLTLRRFINGNVTDITTNGLTDAGTCANFIAPFILDNNDTTGNTMLAGGCSLWRSTDVKGSAPSWSRIQPTGNPISALAVASGHPNVIYTGRLDGSVWKTTNGTSTTPDWTRVDNNGTTPIPNITINRILIDKFNPSRVYIAIGGFNGNSFWVTTNGGTTWETRGTSSTGLPGVPIRGITQHPTLADTLYIGTEIGVFVTSDAGYNWLAVMDGPVNVSVEEVTFMSDSSKLLAATHGKGIWVADLDPPINPEQVVNDFDGDGRSDTAVVRPDQPDSVWYIDRSRTGFIGVQFGVTEDKITAEDYDGDNKTDIGIFRPSEGRWYWMRSSDSTVDVYGFGQIGDIPVPADYDNDNLADLAVYRPASGDWYLHMSSEGDLGFHWGVEIDTPVAADFDGDGRADAAVFRLKEGIWYLLFIEPGKPAIPFQFGIEGDIPVVGDYDGDNIADVAVYRPLESDGKAWWYITSSKYGWGSTVYRGVQWGLPDDYPVPGDYDGDGETDIAVWRPSTGNWHIIRSQPGNGFITKHFGANGDIPVGRKNTYPFLRPVQGSHTRVPSWAVPKRREPKAAH